jgi:four helix bundle protein
MTVRRYQDLLAWQLADELKREVYELVDNSSARNDFNFRDQIMRSASSAPSNIAEGFGYYRHAEFGRHLRIAKSELPETHNHLGDGVDRHHWSPTQAKPIQDLADRAIAVSTRLLQHLATTEAPRRWKEEKRKKKG